MCVAVHPTMQAHTHTHTPVDDAVVVEELEAQGHTGRIEAAALLVKDLPLDVAQQVAAVCELHREAEMRLRSVTYG